MTKEVVRKLLSNIPEEHRVTDDARLEWLWNQRMATVQKIFSETNNVRDRMAATLVLSSTMLANLASIELLLRRLEGGAQSDQAIQEDDSLPI
jgi:hypothetical protein